MEKIIIESFALSEGGEEDFLVRKDGGVKKIDRFRRNQKKSPPWRRESKEREEGGTDWGLDCSNIGEEKIAVLPSRQ